MIFDSRKIQFKNPFGAILSNQKVQFTFPLKDGNFVHCVYIKIRKGENENKERLDYVGKLDGYSLFSKELCFESGIYHYLFEAETEKGFLVFG